MAFGRVTDLGLTPAEALDFNWIKFTVRSDLSIFIIEEVDLSSSKRAVVASVDHLNNDVSSPTSLGSSQRCRFLYSTYTNNHDNHTSPEFNSPNTPLSNGSELVLTPNMQNDRGIVYSGLSTVALAAIVNIAAARHRSGRILMRSSPLSFAQQ